MVPITNIAASQRGYPEYEERLVQLGKKKRVLTIPNAAMSAIHRRLLQRIRFLNAEQRNDVSYGVLPKTSSVENAVRHARHRYVYKLDLCDAYHWVDRTTLATILHTLSPHIGEIGDIWNFLRDYCSGFSVGLATGAPASPTLFDIYCSEVLDRPMLEVCEGMTYTRYFDDLTISSNQPISIGMRKKIREVVTSAGFMINHAKCRVVDRSKRSVTITSVVIAPSGTIRPTDEYLNQLVTAVRRPPRSTTRRQADELNGLASHAESFWKLRKTFRLAPEFVAIRARVRTRIAQLNEIFASRSRKYSGSGRRLSPAYLDTLIQRVSITELAYGYLRNAKWSKTGTEHKALCPFHNEKTPSFFVSEEKAFYHCFGCGAHGDAIRLVIEMEKCGFREAIRRLVERFGEP